MVVIVIGVIEVLGPDITIRYDIRHVLGCLQRIAGRPCYFRLAFRRVLRGNQYDAERSARSINSGSRRVFQYGDALDIVRVQHGWVALHAIDQHERATSVDRAGTAHVEVRRTSRFTIG